MIKRTYNKTCLAETLREAIESKTTDLLEGIVGYDNSSTVLFLYREPTPEEDAILLEEVTNNVASDALIDEQKLQQTKMSEGFDLYRKIFSHIIVNDPLSSIDGFLAIYPQLSILRMLLKDAMFESSMRYMEVTIKPLNAFAYIEVYQQWIRDIAKKHNSSLDDTIIAAIEGAPQGMV